MFFDELLSWVPNAPDWNIHWDKIEQSEISGFVEKMKRTHQNPVWHGEDDVWTHTKMVCEALVALPEFQMLQAVMQQEIFLAALFHDIGKISATKWENEAWTSPHHANIGARMAREFLWAECNVCGTRWKQTFRETVCLLIRYHSVPPHVIDLECPERKLLEIASNGELVPDFSVKLLCMLSKADMIGRMYDGKEESVELVELCEDVARETGCLYGPLKFPSSFSAYSYLKGRDILPEQELYDDTWGEVILMCGLPGTGKDTWIREHCGNLPMISLDVLRKEMGVLPTEEQGAVVNSAKEQAKVYLRQKIPFVWNATNTSTKIRKKLIDMFENYHASVRLVFLETEWNEELRRNGNRQDVVPEQVIYRMLKSLNVPERLEAHKVDYFVV